MKNFFLFLIVALPFVVRAQVIQLNQDPKEKTQETANLSPKPMKTYIDFILEWTSYKYNGEALPQIKVKRHNILQVYAYGEYVYAQAEAKGQKLDTALAFYDIKTKTIYVSDQIQNKSDRLEVSLVHELVHYLQDINGYTASLNGHIECTESEAYDVQMLWQIMNHIHEEEVQYVQERSLFSAMQCMGDMSKAFSMKK